MFKNFPWKRCKLVSRYFFWISESPDLMFFEVRITAYIKLLHKISRMEKQMSIKLQHLYTICNMVICWTCSFVHVLWCWNAVSQIFCLQGRWRAVQTSLFATTRCVSCWSGCVMVRMTAETTLMKIQTCAVRLWLVSLVWFFSTEVTRFKNTFIMFIVC